MMFALNVHAQNLLNKKISVTFFDQPLQKILTEIAHTGNFYFSYNSDVIPEDSLVSIQVKQQMVKIILQKLLGYGYEYEENGRYVIIRKIAGNNKFFTISGYVINKATGEKIPNVSIYESRQFASTLTDEKGYFQLHLKNRFSDLLIGVSKVNFKDTLIQINSRVDQELTFMLSPARPILLPAVTIHSSSKIERMWPGRLFITSKQKIRDLNLSGFFVKQPFQYSVWPGLGTHGKMSAQITNKFSLNLFGGYSAGVNGFEFGSLFNLDKKNVGYVQVAGLFNTVGGKVAGVQVAGLYNSVSDTVKGVQIAGIINHTPNISGVQIAGIGNINTGEAIGVQLAAIFNYTHRQNGMQISLVNISDTATGYSLGLVNIIKKNGYYKLSLSWNEAPGLNVAFKSGRKKLYNILLLGTDLRHHQNIFSFGYGIGREFTISPELSLTMELTEQNFIVGYHQDAPVLVHLQPALQLNLNKKLSLFAGPALAVYFPGASEPDPGNTDWLLPKHYFNIGHPMKGWLGFQVGMNIF